MSRFTEQSSENVVDDGVVGFVIPMFLESGCDNIRTIHNRHLRRQQMRMGRPICAQPVRVALGQVADRQGDVFPVVVDGDAASEPGQQGQLVVVLEGVGVFVGGEEEDLVEQAGQVVADFPAHALDGVA